MAARPQSPVRPAFGLTILPLLLLAAGSVPPPLLAQTPEALLRGQVTVEETGAPLPGAEVRVGSEHRTLTGEDGTYRIQVPGNQSYRVEVLYLGFRTVGRSVRLEGKADRRLDFSLDRDVIELSRLVVEVEGDRRRSWLRREVNGLLRGQAEIFTRREIERIEPTRLTDLFRRVPGVWVQGTLEGGLHRRFAIRSAGRTCTPRVYLDGSPLPDLHPDDIEPSRVAAVAILTRQVSSRFAGCGTILVLTRGYAGA